MKPNELMSGDWVICHHPTCEPKQIQVNVGLLHGLEQQDLGFQTKESPLFRIVEPIPLTSEILEGNGFERWKNDNPCLIYEFKRSEECVSVCVFFPKGYNTRYYKNWAIVSTNENHIGHCVCEYVHELQHALRLCGIEKEIEL